MQQLLEHAQQAALHTAQSDIPHTASDAGLDDTSQPFMRSAPRDTASEEDTSAGQGIPPGQGRSTGQDSTALPGRSAPRAQDTSNDIDEDQLMEEEEEREQTVAQLQFDSQGQDDYLDQTMHDQQHQAAKRPQSDDPTQLQQQPQRDSVTDRQEGSQAEADAFEELAADSRRRGSAAQPSQAAAHSQPSDEPNLQNPTQPQRSSNESQPGASAQSQPSPDCHSEAPAETQQTRGMTPEVVSQAEPVAALNSEVHAQSQPSDASHSQAPATEATHEDSTAALANADDTQDYPIPDKHESPRSDTATGRSENPAQSRLSHQPHSLAPAGIEHSRGPHPHSQTQGESISKAPSDASQSEAELLSKPEMEAANEATSVQELGSEAEPMMTAADNRGSQDEEQSGNADQGAADTSHTGYSVPSSSAEQQSQQQSSEAEAGRPAPAVADAVRSLLHSKLPVANNLLLCVCVLLVG